MQSCLLEKPLNSMLGTSHEARPRDPPPCFLSSEKRARCPWENAIVSGAWRGINPWLQGMCREEVPSLRALGR